MRIGRLRPEQPYLLCLQDPSTPINDLGARCHAIKHVQETIKVMHAELVRSMEEYDQTNPDSKPRDGDTRESLLMPLVGRSHELYAERRKRMVAGNPKALPEKVQFRRINIDSPDHLRGGSQQQQQNEPSLVRKTTRATKSAKQEAARKKKTRAGERQDTPSSVDTTPKDEAPGA